MATEIVSVLATLGVNSKADQFSPSAGTLVIRNHDLYGFVLVNGVETWYPLVRSTTQTFEHDQKALGVVRAFFLSSPVNLVHGEFKTFFKIGHTTPFLLDF